MEFLSIYFHELWIMTTQLAPWLLVGFALAGLISLYVRRSLVMRVLGKPGIGSIVRATLVGVPMPLCSCGVIPVAAAIREKGAGKGATAAFLASTPETGIDSFAATWGMLGPVMACLRVLIAFVTGIFSGLLVHVVTRKEPVEFPGADAVQTKEERPTFREAVNYAFVNMPEKMARSLAFGLLVAAAIAALVPGDFFASFGATGILAYIVITLVAVPLYVCSTGSIPLALAMVSSGFSPGCALVFLISGPATNVTTIATMRRYLGLKAITAYLFAIVAVAWTAGAVVDAGFGRETIMGQMPHNMEHVTPLGIASAIILIALLLRGLIAPILRNGGKLAGASCCHSEAATSCSCHGASSQSESCQCHEEQAESHTCHCHDVTAAEGESSPDKKKGQGGSCCCGH
jgi:uncharacterized membrane protein YraQ (UPF0718 family)